MLFKASVFLTCLAPLASIFLQVWWQAAGMPNDLGADPAKYITHFFGETALLMMVLTLWVTPLRGLTGWAVVVRVRRMLGLYAFFYALLHMVSYAALLLEWHIGEIGKELVERPYITVGFMALCLMVPLAATSNRWATRRLGRNWKRLHRMVFPVAALQLLHFFWLTRSDYTEPLLYSAALLIAMAYRWYKWRSGLQRKLSFDHAAAG